MSIFFIIYYMPYRKSDTVVGHVQIRIRKFASAIDPENSKWNMSTIHDGHVTPTYSWSSEKRQEWSISGSSAHVSTQQYTDLPNNSGLSYARPNSSFNTQTNDVITSVGKNYVDHVTSGVNTDSSGYDVNNTFFAIFGDGRHLNTTTTVGTNRYSDLVGNVTSGGSYDLETSRLVVSGLMVVCILVTIVGNILVVLSVFNYAPLRNVQNFFIVSLACADLAVALLVMPFSVANYLADGRWPLGAVLCHAWLTSDILTCTASILHLCAIALDRYNAIHDPIGYAVERTRSRVLVKIGIVWAASALISVPPLFGWSNSAAGHSLYDSSTLRCQLTDEKSFVIYSASGSFYIPLFIMTFVYVKIFLATRARLRTRMRSSGAAKLRGSRVNNSTREEFLTTEAPEVASPDAGKRGKLDNNARCIQRETTTFAGLEDEKIGLRSPDFKADEATSSSRDLKTGAIWISRDQKYGRNNSSRDSEYEASDDECKTGRSRPGDRKDDPSEALKCDPTGRSNHSTNGDPKRTNRRFIVGCCRCFSSRCHDERVDEPTIDNQILKFSQERQRISLTKERRAARTMAIIMSAFVVCWLPFFVIYVAFPFCKRCEQAVDPNVVLFIVWLGYVNSTLNPIIYNVFNIDFRRAFHILLCRGGKRHFWKKTHSLSGSSIHRSRLPRFIEIFLLTNRSYTLGNWLTCFGIYSARRRLCVINKIILMYICTELYS